ncbi:hypothetical protein BCV63_03750 [Cylindrospermopsis raciborskii CS-508]|uniref:Uncharacterized protein n=1 Tax=Cylindrospermopsis raciborskii CS-505 TaxID=533240 RepID=A0A853MG86_9CYAN|nr:hypothetical protein [Cylindrospermopsis raciborskii]EFA71069.1 hypothetical protein CRC_00294 [Cylindrospermopsis raciborskii CS-505]OBU76148.1 hypothetical protein A9P98_07300 [Cylindrospermopsis raciborskii CS-505]OHY34618.1 hypothetical protein BCV63_03750 [Cylindrospermopsis raciborskii CS-508]
MGCSDFSQVLAKNIPTKTITNATKFKALKASAKINLAKIAVQVGSSSKKIAMKLEENCLSW